MSMCIEKIVMKMFKMAVAVVFVCLVPLSLPALEVVFDGRTPQENREWIDKNYIREQMDAVAAKICQALYVGRKDANRSEAFTITLFPTPEKKGNPGFASGRRLTWRVGKNPGGDASGGIGLLCHEMTHIFDYNAAPMSKQKFKKVFDSKMVESTAVYITDYFVKYGYVKCSSPSIILDRRYEALRYHRVWGKYRKGAGFLDFVDQAYGPGMGLKLIWEQQHGKNPWERLLKKNLDTLLAEWREMETIYDPVFQWNYNGTVAGAVRNDKKFCGLKKISAEDASDKSGAWLVGATAGKVDNVADGSITLALHGRFPKKDKVTIASLGAAKEGNGKAILIATTSRPNMLAAYVVATLPGKGCQIVSTTPIPLPPTPGTQLSTHNSQLTTSTPRSPFPVPRSLILSVKGGDAAEVIVDGKTVAEIDMKAKCNGCTFSPVFAVGGMAKGIGVGGFSEPRGEGGVLLDDVRVFTRAFRAKEIASYAATFGPDYRGAVAVEATWCGPQGGTDIDNPNNWTCFNAYGEKIIAVPSKETEVAVWFKAIPSIPPKAKFDCKSFTIDGLAVVDSANIDLRGAGVVDLADNTRIITTNGHFIAASKIRANRIRLNGTIAVTTALKADGKFDMKGGSILRLPEDPSAAFVGELAFSGDGKVSIRPGVMPQKARTSKVLRVDNLPEDLSRLKLHGLDDSSAAEFKPSGDKKSLTVYRRK